MVTAVAGTEGEGDQPSRFLAELGVPVRELPGRPRRPLTLAALVAELRSMTVDPETSPQLREEAAIRLARLADATDARRPSAGTGRATRPLVGDAAADSRRPAAGVCAAAGPAVRQSARQGAGLPAAVVLGTQGQGRVRASGGRELRLGDPRAGGARGTAVTLTTTSSPIISSRSGTSSTSTRNWLSAVERVEAESALERFVTWQEARPHLELLGTEVPFSCEVDLGGERVRLTGSADRVEREPDGRIRIVDFKTSKTAPTAADVALHDQLGVYQLAVQQGAFAARCRGGRAAGGRRAGLSPAAGRRERSPEGLPAGLAGRRSVPSRAADGADPTQFPTSRPGCIAGLPRPPRSSGANATTHGSEPAAGTARSEPAAPPSQPVARWSHERPHSGAAGTADSS